MKVHKLEYVALLIALPTALMCTYWCWEQVTEGHDFLAFYFAFFTAVNGTNAWKSIHYIYLCRRI